MLQDIFGGKPNATKKYSLRYCRLLRDIQPAARGDIGMKQSGSIFPVRNVEFSWGNGLDAEEQAPG